MTNYFLTLFIFCATALGVLAQTKEIAFTTDPVKLPETINTNVTNAEPKLSPDGKRLYFCRRSNAYNYGGADIWYSDQNADGSWGKAINPGKPINDEDNNMLIGARSDGNALLLLGNYDKLSYSDLYITYKTPDSWTKPKLLNIKNSGRISSSCITADFNTIVLTKQSTITNSSDLFVSFMNDDGSWTEPLYMGDIVNSLSAEAFPTIANDGKTLYFSSEGMGGYGSYDLFMTTRLDSSWTKWSKPVNMGNKINTPSYDADFTVDVLGKYAYISSNYGSVDEIFSIYNIELPEDAKPKPVIVYSGKVLNTKTNKPIAANVTYHRISDGKVLGSFTSGTTGDGFTIILPVGEKYGFEATANNFISISDYIDLTSETGHKTIDKNIKMVPFEVGQTVRMNNLFFAVGSAQLEQGSYSELKKIIALLNKNKSMTIQITGHTDSDGNAETNKTLSTERAKNVAEYIIKTGIKTERISYKGLGETKPIASNKTDEGKNNNRRVEFIILKK